MSFYFDDILLGVPCVLRPVFPVGSGTTVVVQTMNLGQLMFIECIVTNFSGSSSLLYLDAVVHKPYYFLNHTN